MPGTDKASEIDPDVILSVCFPAHCHQHRVHLAPTVSASRVLPGLSFFASAVQVARMTFLSHFLLALFDFSFVSQVLYHFYCDIFSYCSAPSLSMIHRFLLSLQGTLCMPLPSYTSPESLFLLVPLLVRFHERRSEALTGLQLTVFLA